MILIAVMVHTQGLRAFGMEFAGVANVCKNLDMMWMIPHKLGAQGYEGDKPALGYMGGRPFGHRNCKV